VTPEEEYTAWETETAARVARLPSPLYVREAREAVTYWGTLQDDTSRVRARRTARVRTGLTIEWTQPETAIIRRRAQYTFMHIHGAAQNGSAASYRPLAAQIAAGVPATVAMLDYRRPPEYPFPAVVDDVMDALAWLETRRRPMSRVVISGDSFGAMPALAAVMRRRTAGRDLPAGIYLICPDADYSNRGYLASRDYYPNPATCLVTDALNQYFPTAYPHDGPDASPGLEDLTGLPPILMHESRDNPLTHAQDLKVALEEADATFEYEDWNNTPHVFPTYGSAFTATTEAMAALRTWVEAL
jgi:epsilon-lactone hydrolase